MNPCLPVCHTHLLLILNCFAWLVNLSLHLLQDHVNVLVIHHTHHQLPASVL